MNIQYGEPNLGSSYSVVGSFPKSFGYGVDDQDQELDPEDGSSPSASRPRILLMGLRRSGKSSIQKVPRFCSPRPRYTGSAVLEVFHFGFFLPLAGNG